ncbi:hypothetical protein E2562_028839, partial [Oryza meyeriana var. granulata]
FFGVGEISTTTAVSRVQEVALPCVFSASVATAWALRRFGHHGWNLAKPLLRQHHPNNNQNAPRMKARDVLYVELKLHLLYGQPPPRRRFPTLRWTTFSTSVAQTW